jgi:hypothetical protein
MAMYYFLHHTMMHILFFKANKVAIAMFSNYQKGLMLCEHMHHGVTNFNEAFEN